MDPVAAEATATCTYTGHYAGDDYFTTVCGGRRYMFRLPRWWPEEEQPHRCRCRVVLVWGSSVIPSDPHHVRTLRAAAAATVRAGVRARGAAMARGLRLVDVVALGVEGGQRLKQEECAVCLRDFDDRDEGGKDEKAAAAGRLRAMPCGHAFHEGCIAPWLGRNPVCPLCRYRLRPDDLLASLEY